eukprot:7505337-Pyramimonas_sp.AAC.1
MPPMASPIGSSFTAPPGGSATPPPVSGVAPGAPAGGDAPGGTAPPGVSGLGAAAAVTPAARASSAERVHWIMRPARSSDRRRFSAGELGGRPRRERELTIWSTNCARAW